MSDLCLQAYPLGFQKVVYTEQYMDTWRVVCAQRRRVKQADRLRTEAPGINETPEGMHAKCMHKPRSPSHSNKPTLQVVASHKVLCTLVPFTHRECMLGDSIHARKASLLVTHGALLWQAVTLQGDRSVSAWPPWPAEHTALTLHSGRLMPAWAPRPTKRPYANSYVYACLAHVGALPLADPLPCPEGPRKGRSTSSLAA